MTDEDPERDSLVRKVRLILAAFDSDSPLLGLSDLSRATGLAKSTVHRVATEMADVGLLERAERRYMLGGLLFQMGQRVPRTLALRVTAARYLEQLAVATRETVVLASPGEKSVLFAEKYLSQRGGGVTVADVEGRVPFHCGASGKALLAFGDPAAQRRLLALPLARRTPWTITDPELMAVELAQIRRQGFAVDRLELVVGYAAIAAPVHSGGVAIATLTVVGPVDRIQVSRLAPVITNAAASLARELFSS